MRDEGSRATARRANGNAFAPCRRRRRAKATRRTLERDCTDATRRYEQRRRRWTRGRLGRPVEQGRGPIVSNANFLAAADLLHSWRDDVLSGTPPVLYPVGAGELKQIEIGPGRVLLIGGAPGAGKSAFTMQVVVDAL